MRAGRRGFSLISGILSPIGGECLDIPMTQRRQNRARRQHHAGKQSPASQYRVDECPVYAAVTVRERVNRLELRVDECRLNERSMCGTVEVPQQVLDQTRNQVRRRRHEVRLNGVIRGSPQPVLNRSDSMMPR